MLKSSIADSTGFISFLWNWTNAKIQSIEDQYNVMLPYDEFSIVFDLLSENINKTSSNINENQLRLISQNIYGEILKKHNNILNMSEEDLLQTFTMLEAESWAKYPELYIKLAEFEFPSCLLSSFTRRYCLRDSDAILIMSEYLKFLTICKVSGANFSPSTWVDEFWHHHMSFDTKQYREFWESVFGHMVEHQEYDPTNLKENDRISILNEDADFRTKYIQTFGSSPPKCIWPILPCNLYLIK